MIQSTEYVIFKLNNEHYGINIRNVENIEKLIPITRVPYSEKFVEGVVNLRGVIIPVVDLRKRFAIPMSELTDESRIIIVNISELKVGMIVDSSSEVLKLEREDIDVAPSVRGNAGTDYIREIGKNDGRIIMLIDLHKVLGVEEFAEE
jgi:purine-binding chemotaxis protein CheW